MKALESVYLWVGDMRVEEPCCRGGLWCYAISPACHSPPWSCCYGQQVHTTAPIGILMSIGVKEISIKGKTKKLIIKAKRVISYAYGLGIERDRVQAYKWYEIAMKYWGPLAVRAKDAVATEMTPEEIAQASNLANQWLKARRN